MIYLIFGENIFFARKKIQQLLKERRKFFNKNFPILKLDGKEISLSLIEKEMKNKTLFGGEVVIIVEDVWKNQKFKKDFIKRGEEFKDSEIFLIFFERGGLDKKDEFFKFIQKVGEIYEFPEPNIYQIKKFIKEILQKKGFQITKNAEKLFVNFVGRDFFELSSQLEKLVAYKNKEKIIEEKDVWLLVKPKIEVDIFKTIDAMGERNKEEALRLIWKHLQKGDSPFYILSMIKYQFRNLLVIKERGLVFPSQEIEKIHPFVLRKTSKQAKRFSLQQLKKFYHKIFKIDFAIKTGKMSPEEALELLILDL